MQDSKKISFIADKAAKEFLSNQREQDTKNEKTALNSLAEKLFSTKDGREFVLLYIKLYHKPKLLQAQHASATITDMSRALEVRESYDFLLSLLPEDLLLTILKGGVNGANK
jgi:hypothetical protein